MDGIDEQRRMADIAGATPADEPMAAPRRFRALFIGNESLLAECVEAWKARGHGIAAVVASGGPAGAWFKRMTA